MQQAASSDSSSSARSITSSAPMAIRRTVSSQPGLLGQSISPNTQSIARPGGSIPRRQSAQERIDEILEVGKQRAISMNLQAHSPRRTPTMAPDRAPQPPDHVGEPDERTSLGTTSNGVNYQSTQTMSSLRSRQQHLHHQANTATQDANRPREVEEETHWLWHCLDGIWSIELENTGSVARDHLAVERTFLAWLRTSLSFASIGIAITQLFRLNASLTDGQPDENFRRLGKPLGTVFIGISILVLLLGYQRFYEPQQWLLKGKFPASRGPIILISFVSFALMLTSLIVVAVVQPPSAR